MTWESTHASRQNYQCMDCGQFDSSVQFEGEPIPDAIACMACGSGRQQGSTLDMIRVGKGMRPVAKEHRDKFDVWTSPKDYARLDINRAQSDGGNVVENNNTNVN